MTGNPFHPGGILAHGSVPEERVQFVVSPADGPVLRRNRRLPLLPQPGLQGLRGGGGGAGIRGFDGLYQLRDLYPKNTTPF